MAICGVAAVADTGCICSMFGVAVDAFLTVGLVHASRSTHPLAQYEMNIFLVAAPITEANKVGLTKGALVWPLLVRLLGILAGSNAERSFAALLERPRGHVGDCRAHR